MKNRSRIITLGLVVVFFFMMVLPVMAGGDPGDGTGIELDDPLDIGLGTIQLPTFITLEYAKNFSIFSYLVLFVQFAFVGMAVYWIYLAIRAAVDIIGSAGKSEKLESSKNRFGAIFWSISFMFIFIAGLSLVTYFFGLGTFFTWPEVFSQCDIHRPDGRPIFFYQIVISGASQDVARAACFGDTGYFRPSTASECYEQAFAHVPDEELADYLQNTCNQFVTQ